LEVYLRQGAAEGPLGHQSQVKMRVDVQESKINKTSVSSQIQPAWKDFEPTYQHLKRVSVGIGWQVRLLCP